MADKYADRIAEELADYLTKRGGIAVPECPHNGFRFDILYYNEDNLFVDFEIKTTVSDYFNDFQKINKYRERRHELYTSGELFNRFYFVFPPHLVSEKDVPIEYGIMHYLGNCNFEVVRHSENFELEDYSHIINSFALCLARRNEFYLLEDKYNSDKEYSDYRCFELEQQLERLTKDFMNICDQRENLVDETERLKETLRVYESRYGHLINL